MRLEKRKLSHDLKSCNKLTSTQMIKYTLLMLAIQTRRNTLKFENDFFLKCS